MPTIEEIIAANQRRIEELEAENRKRAVDDSLVGKWRRSVLEHSQGNTPAPEGGDVFPKVGE